MSSGTNQQLVGAFYGEINRGGFNELARYCHDDFRFYHQVDTPHFGVAGFVASETKNFDAFSNWRMSLQDMIATDDKVAAYMIFEGDHTGDWKGIAPTGRRLRFSLLMWLTIQDDKIVEKRAHFDQADIKAQLTR
ncbi:ester cyclase [Brevundimonas intermedia]|uniref:Ester cyclase n=1 Tax=Brevundimonas intermedia TaxID=74315 RepID=A0A4Y9S195_9CAUL|nr:ester cyclase [Brevundimonas intermedia]